MAVIDEYSMATLPIEMLFNNTYVSLATAFVWKHFEQFFIVTNWHNLSGRDPSTGKHLSRTAAEPNKIRAYWNTKGQIGQRSPVVHDIRDAQNKPLWWIHLVHGYQVDVAILPIDDQTAADMYPINLMSVAIPPASFAAPLAIQIGMDVFILGYPFGIGSGGFPVWKRGSIASEPQVGFPIFVDTASRQGMSGSPAIRRSWAVHLLENGDVIRTTGTATRFFGIYSGRLATQDPLDAQLGLIWPAYLLDEIISGAKRDA